MLEQLDYYRSEVCNDLQEIYKKIDNIIENGLFKKAEGMVIVHKDQFEEDDDNSSDPSHITEVDTDIDYYYILKSNGQFEKLVSTSYKRMTHGSGGMYSDQKYDFQKCGIEEIMLETDFSMRFRRSFKTRVGFDYIYGTSHVGDYQSLSEDDLQYLNRVGINKGDGLIQFLDNILSNDSVRANAIAEYERLIKEIKDYEKSKRDMVNLVKKQKDDECRKSIIKGITGSLSVCVGLFLTVYGFIYTNKNFSWDDYTPVSAGANVLVLCYLVTIGYNFILTQDANYLITEVLWNGLILLESISYGINVILMSLISEDALFFFINLFLFISTFVVATNLGDKEYRKRIARRFKKKS